MGLRAGKRAITFAVLAGWAAACTSPEEAASPGFEGRPPAPEAVALGEPGPVVIGELPAIGPKVIKTANVRLEVERDGFLEALRHATAVAGTYGGFVVSSTVEGERARRGSLVIRVPADRFEAALAEIRDLGTVRRERVAGEDVGQEFVDLEARLRNLRAHEALVLRLYERAQTIPESLRVQKEVSGVQLRIEEIEGRLRYLRDQAALGTISIGLVETGVVPDAPQGVIQRSWQRAVDGFLAVIAGIIAAMGVIVPVGILALLAIPVVRRVRARSAA